MKTRATTRGTSRRSTRNRLTSNRGTRTSSRRQSMRGKSRAGQRASQRSSARASSGRTSRSAKRTTDHDEIREWAESRGGHPATVKQTRRQGQPAGVIRIDFPGFSGQATLKEITWKEWFDIFEKRKLAFLYQNLKNSRFNKLVERED